MKRSGSWSALVCLATLGGMGCAGEGDTPPASNPAAAAPGPKNEPKSEPKAAPKGDEGPKMEGPKGATAPAASAPSEENLAAIKKLPADEQKLAIAQGVCPVSGEPLGEMGVPLKVTAEGRTFYLCCKSCEADLKADPKAAIAKLDKKK